MSSRYKKIKTRFTEADHRKPSPIKGKAWLDLSTEELVAVAKKNNGIAVEALKFRYNKRLEKGKSPIKAAIEALRKFGVLPEDQTDTRSDASDRGLRPAAEAGSTSRAPGAAERPLPLYIPEPVEPVPPAPATPLPVAVIGHEKWDEQQNGIIELESDRRVIVDAGPGCGKTAVACARVAFLINRCGIEPHHIWLISFTRTAVRELRNRIGSYLEDPDHAYQLRIFTLDSAAWVIHSGFRAEAKLTGYHDQNIETALELVRKDGETAEALRDIRHLVVDEAQDITGIRADLVEAILSKLDPECGVSIFCDEAQSIYGFTEETTASSAGANLARRLMGSPGKYPFLVRELETIYRTGSAGLKSIFGEGRKIARQSTGDETECLYGIKELVKAKADGAANQRIDQQGLAGRDDVLVLFRRRAEVLLASQALASAGTMHRVRMSKLGSAIQPWIGVLLWDCTDSKLTEDTFFDLWVARIATSRFAGGSPQEGWQLLVRFAGISRSVIDLKRLRAILSRVQPPVDFCLPEFGTSGPIVGTIHASKGREADVVHLMIPPAPGEDAENTDLAEETRVVFVGATRARRELMHAKGFKRLFARVLDGSCRVYSPRRKDDRIYAQVQVGVASDIDPGGLAGRSCFRDETAARDAQRLILAMLPGVELSASLAKFGKEYRYAIALPENECPIGYFASGLSKDLLKIGQAMNDKGKKAWLAPNPGFDGVHCFGIRTVAVPEGPATDSLHEPWRQSRILLAPMALGFCYIDFKKKRRQA